MRTCGVCLRAHRSARRSGVLAGVSLDARDIVVSERSLDDVQVRERAAWARDAARRSFVDRIGADRLGQRSLAGRAYTLAVVALGLDERGTAWLPFISAGHRHSLPFSHPDADYHCFFAGIQAPSPSAVVVSVRRCSIVRPTPTFDR